MGPLYCPGDSALSGPMKYLILLMEGWFVATWSETGHGKNVFQQVTHPVSLTTQEPRGVDVGCKRGHKWQRRGTEIGQSRNRQDQL